MPKLRLSALLALLFAGIVTAQSPDPSKSSTFKPDYSQEASVVEQYSEKYKFENDGTAVKEVSARIRVQSDAGVKSAGLLAFKYASGTGPFEIEYVRVRKPDGTTVDTPADSIQDMPVEITRQAPFYSDLREKHVAVKGLAVGDVLEYKTTDRTTKPLAPGQFWLAYSFSHDVILLHETLEVSIPAGRTIKWKSPDSKPAISDSGAYRVYTWSSSSLERTKPDEKLEAAKLIYQSTRGRFPPPDVQLTTFQSWNELGRWYLDLQKDRVKPTPEIQAKAAELTKNLPDDDAKLHAIYNYVSTQFRYIGIAFGVGRYQPHSAAEVLANQYGDCKDKHTLLAALLAASGIKAYPALISSQYELDPDLPSPMQVNHVISAIPRGNSIIFLDTTTEVGPYPISCCALCATSMPSHQDEEPAALLTTPPDLPYPAIQNFQMQAASDDSGTLTGTAELSAAATWKSFCGRFSLHTHASMEGVWFTVFPCGLGFAGEVSDISASSPEKTDEPFHLTYKYVRKEFGDWPNRRILAPESGDHPARIARSIRFALPTPFLLGATHRSFLSLRPRTSQRLFCPTPGLHPRETRFRGVRCHVLSKDGKSRHRAPLAHSPRRTSQV